LRLRARRSLILIVGHRLTLGVEHALHSRRERLRRFRLREHRGWRRRFAWSRPGGLRAASDRRTSWQNEDLIEFRVGRDRSVPPPDAHEPGSRFQQDVQRFLFADVVELERHWSAGDTVAVDDFRLTETSPLIQNLFYRGVDGHEPDASRGNAELDRSRR
jgi:hypothetical protein